MNRTILPGSTIGIIGGGQLGRMLAVAAKQMGYKIAVLDPVKDGPCAQIADFEINTEYDDNEGLKRLLEISDVVTYEFENIPGYVIRDLENLGYIPQGFRPLVISQNRAMEKTVINESGFKTAPFEIINNKIEFHNALNIIGYPAVLKTCTGGYDGKGQVVLKTENDLTEAYKLLEVSQCVLEKFIKFTKEISAIVTRSTKNETSVFPIAWNIHVNNILYKTIVPAMIDEKLQVKAQELATNLINSLNFVGTLAVEMFVTDDDEILINEIAPRPHNSGHYTIEGCYTSQFEQHIRAICGLKLGDTSLIHPTIMINLLGQDLEYAMKLLENDSFSNFKFHLYGKSQAKINRKMGHITFFDKNQKQLLEEVDKLFGEGEKNG